MESDSPIEGGEVAGAEPVDGAPEPAEAGTAQSFELPDGTKRYVALRAVDEQDNVGRTAAIDTGAAGGPGEGGSDGGGAPGGGDGGSDGTGGGRPRGQTPGRGRARPCMPRRLRVTSRRIGPARLRGGMRRLQRRYRVANRDGAVRFCVRGGGRFLVRSRRGRIVLVASTAPGHRTRRIGPGERSGGRRLTGVRRARPSMFVGPRGSRSTGRVVYGTHRGRLRYLAVVPRRDAQRPLELARRLKRLGCAASRRSLSPSRCRRHPRRRARSRCGPARS